MEIPYSEKFLYGANFRIFCMSAQYAKIKIYENLNVRNFVMLKTMWEP